MSVQSPKTGEASRHQKQKAIVISFMGEKKGVMTGQAVSRKSHEKQYLKSFDKYLERKQNNKKRSDRSYNSGLYVEGKLLRGKAWKLKGRTDELGGDRRGQGSKVTGRGSVCVKGRVERKFQLQETEMRAVWP